MHDQYITDDATGQGWRLMLGDSCERLGEIPDDSVDLSVYSPPFASLYTYSPSPRDIGNCRDEQEFAEHYGFVIREMLRVTKPGRVSAVHVQDVARTKAAHGFMGLHDLPGDVIRAHTEAGWIYFGRTTVDKDPQAQAIRTKSHALMFVTKNRDSAGSRPALADYLLIFKKPGDNETQVKTDVTNDEWIQWARPIWARGDDPFVHDGLIVPPPAWSGIRETDTLNAKLAREDADERHICPLQLGFIERCVRLWSNPGETIMSPFAGIGSEVYSAVKLGRRGVGIELKASYWRTAVDNLRRLEAESEAPTLL
jgi:DNA modification methylase